MYPLLWLGLVTLCQAGSDQATISPFLIEDIFGTPSPESFTPSPVASSENIQSSYASCTTESGESGECVNFYQCDSNRVMIGHGSNFVDARFNDDCTMYQENCCLRDDILDPSDPIVPPHQGNAPVHEGCGWRNPDGVGGAIEGGNDKVTKFGEFPWVVAILKIRQVDENEPNGGKVYMYAGGGSLIHQKVVLTAAHILTRNDSIVVRAGEWDTHSSLEAYPHQQKEVLNMAVHRKFQKGNLHYDIALLFLSEPLDLAPNVGVVCLPPPSQRVSGGTRCTVSGWGKDKFSTQGHYQSLLKKVEVPVVEHRKCEAALRKTRLGSYFKLDSSFMCAGGEGEDMCNGDGGAPLVCPIEGESNRFTQYGIVAWGIGCGSIDIPGVYVDVAFLRTWIDDQIVFRKLSPEVYTYSNQAPGMTPIKAKDSSALDSQPDNLPINKPDNYLPNYDQNNFRFNVHPSYNYSDNIGPSSDKPGNDRTSPSIPYYVRTSSNNIIPDNKRHSYDYTDNEHPSYNNPDNLRTKYNKPDDDSTSYNNHDNKRPSYNNPNNLHTTYNKANDDSTSYNNHDNKRPSYNNPDNLHTRYHKPDDDRNSYDNHEDVRPRSNNPGDASPSYRKPINTGHRFDY